MDSVASSLDRLGVDHIDLYQIHHQDPLTPEEEALRALDDLVSQRLVRYIGCSNRPAWQAAKALGISAHHGWAKFDTRKPISRSPDGSVPDGDVIVAESQLAADETMVPELDQQLSIARHVLAVLLGRAPSNWSPPDFDLTRARKSATTGATNRPMPCW